MVVLLRPRLVSISNCDLSKSRILTMYIKQYPVDHTDKDKVTINFMNRVLDPLAVTILSKGLNFSHTMSVKCNLKQVTIGVE
jgi:hypothetical protein